jgi:hypothetical protein
VISVICNRVGHRIRKGQPGCITCLANRKRQLGCIVGLLLVCVTATACGKKGAPLPPLRRVPAAATDLVAERYADDVFVRLTVPATNMEGPGAANLSRIEIYGITTTRPLTTKDVQTEAVRKLATLVASEAVRPPVPPAPASEPVRPPPPPLEPGLDQGAQAVVREALNDDAMQAVSTIGASTPPAYGLNVAVPSGPLVAPDAATGPRRYYFAVGVTPNGRYGAASAPVAVPLGPATSMPTDLRIVHDEQSFTLRWSPPADARASGAPSVQDGILPSRPLVPAPPPTRYDVYSLDAAGPSQTAVAAPDALNDEPLSAAEFRVSGVTFGRERCFVVRSVDVVGNVAMRGPVSARACVTPRDTFAPAAPRSLQAVSGAATISLIWEANSESDLAGYIVLRGESPGGTLTPRTRDPIREPRFDDTTVQAGVRYVYAVVAVDNASPPNMSAQSNRAEETARQ